MQNAELTRLIVDCLQEVLAELGAELPEGTTPGPDTALLGRGAVLDSLGLVRLVLEVEERVQDAFDVSVSLADERAMSQQRSPFRSVASLAEYIDALAQEAKGA